MVTLRAMIAARARRGSGRPCVAGLRAAPAGGDLRSPETPRPQSRQQHDADERHHDVQCLAGAERKTVRGIVAREIDEEAEERIPEDEVRGDRAGRRVATPHPQQQRDQRQVLDRVVEHDRVSEALGVGELHGPGHAGDAPDNLPVDEVPDPADGHQEGAGNHELVGKLAERNTRAPREQPDAGRAADEQAVRGHAAQPQRGHQRDMVAIERPFVERDLDRATTDQDAGGEPDREPVDVVHAEAQPGPLPAHPEVHLQEAERVAHAVPPEIQPADLPDHRVDVVNEGAGHRT